MIIDNLSITKYGYPPKEVTNLAEQAFKHGKSFSQSEYCIYIKFLKELESWLITDNFCREIYKSILYNEKQNKFRVYSKASLSVAEYNKEITPEYHAKQFFMPGVVDSLFND